jgi:hypothetical protein
MAREGPSARRERGQQVSGGDLFNIARRKREMKKEIAEGKPARMIYDLHINEVSGVDHPATMVEGWAVMKSVGNAAPEYDGGLLLTAAEVEQIGKALDERAAIIKAYETGQGDMAANYLNGVLERCGMDIPDSVKAAAQAVVDFLRSAEPQPVVKSQPRQSLGDRLMGR